MSSPPPGVDPDAWAELKAIHGDDPPPPVDPSAFVRTHDRSLEGLDHLDEVHLSDALRLLGVEGLSPDEIRDRASLDDTELRGKLLDVADRLDALSGISQRMATLRREMQPAPAQLVENLARLGAENAARIRTARKARETDTLGLGASTTLPERQSRG